MCFADAVTMLVRHALSGAAIAALFLGTTVTSAQATNGNAEQSPTIDVSGSAHGSQIIAGVQYGISPAAGGGADPQCEWSESLPHDAAVASTGETVTKKIGTVKYRLYDYSCPSRTPPTTYHWIPQLSSEALAHNAAAVVYDNLPAPWGNFAPPAKQGIINVGMWFWVNWALWVPVSVTVVLLTPSGPISVTTTATPKKLIFEPGDGILGTGPVTCTGPGWIWLTQFGDHLASPCMYSYQHSSATQPNGLFSATVSMQWNVTWRSSLGIGGTIGDISLDAHHQILIREAQALVTR